MIKALMKLRIRGVFLNVKSLNKVSYSPGFSSPKWEKRVMKLRVFHQQRVFVFEKRRI
jgi:hypothetical protein